VRTFIRPLAGLKENDLESVFKSLESDGRTSLERLKLTRYTVERRLEMRYVGQGHEVEVKVPPRGPRWLERIRASFEAEYIRLFGRLPGRLPVEIINCRLAVSSYAQDVDLCPPVKGRKDRALKGRRSAFFADARKAASCGVYERSLLAPGELIKGPAIIEEPECTIIIPPRSTARVDRYGNIVMSYAKGTPR
jgi:N-methylhydantoinase A